MNEILSMFRWWIDFWPFVRGHLSLVIVLTLLASVLGVWDVEKRKDVKNK